MKFVGVRMKILLVKYVCKEGLREAFFKAIKENQIDVLSRQDKGNLKYDYSYSAEEKNVLVLNEVWESDVDAQAHMEARHFAKLGELKAKFVDEVKIEKYKAEIF